MACAWASFWLHIKSTTALARFGALFSEVVSSGLAFDLGSRFRWLTRSGANGVGQGREYVTRGCASPWASSTLDAPGGMQVFALHGATTGVA